MQKFRVIFFLIFALFFSNVAFSQAPTCSRFRLHLHAALPKAKVDEKNQNRELPGELTSAIETWQNHLPFLKDPIPKQNWINCIRQFIFLDTDQDGLPDWTAVIDGRPSRILFPFDPDLDGDQIANLFDPDPYRVNKSQARGKIPPHLLLTGESGLWQKMLFEDFHLLAVNHTDQHSSQILKTFYELMKLSTIRSWQNQKDLLQVLYAFNARTEGGDLAAYHPLAHAISLPGRSTYDDDYLSQGQRCRLAQALIHEIGHAVLFGSLASQELTEKAQLHGGWTLAQGTIKNLWSPPLFDPYKGQSQLVSEYAKTNVHEWFAESFAAYVWQKESLDQKYCRTFQANRTSASLGDWVDALLKKTKN